MRQIDGQMSIFDFISPPKPKQERTPPIHRYLRYGAHTLIPKVREETRQYLEKNGVPDWVSWDKNSLPCSNCTWYDGSVCKGGAHTCHYEFGYLICDRFYQSIVERKPSTVGDALPAEKIHPVDIYGICDDAYCPECHSPLDDLKILDCERCPWCGIRIDWTPWHRMNDPEEDAGEDPG